MTFDVIFADPPWRYDFSKSKSRQIENQYGTQTLAEICAVPVASFAAPDALLCLWVPATKVPEGCAVIAAWGFTFKTGRVWDKQRLGMGYHTRNQHEHLFIATRGKWKPPAPSLRPPSVFALKRGKHSEKPSEPQERVEYAYPHARKVELYARAERPGWTCWGLELGWRLSAAGAEKTA